ncbi:MAG TPA: TIGR03619 family F420-dependent LLM class oxidoreductase [Acidimicrobiales bacterium]|nr:TIGR03619 family F420-dependent LLM class oxidoreductase [Acidimicrobiales bacterium]
MRLGLFLINIDVCATDPAAAVRIAVAAEAAGWESVWTGEHYVLPDPPVPASPTPGDTPMLDPFVALAFLAAHTDTLRLGTGVTVVPVHHPLVLAKQVASIDRVSGGRFLFGVGVGYLEPEFRALGVPLAERASRMDDHLDAMRAVWRGETAHEGRHTSFAGVRAEPRPSRPDGPPLHVGGYVPAAYRRAVTRGHGWYGFALDPAEAATAIAELRAALERHERPAELGAIEISITPPPGLVLDDGALAAYASLGVTRLIALPPRAGARDADVQVRFVEELGARIGAHPDLVPA